MRWSPVGWPTMLCFPAVKNVARQSSYFVRFGWVDWIWTGNNWIGQNMCGRMIKSIKGLLRLSIFKTSLWIQSGTGDVFALIVSGLQKSVCSRSGDLCSTSVSPSQRHIHWSETLRGGQSTVTLTKKEILKVGWHDCFSAVLIIKGSSIHNS